MNDKKTMLEVVLFYFFVTAVSITAALGMEIVCIAMMGIEAGFKITLFSILAIGALLLFPRLVLTE